MSGYKELFEFLDQYARNHHCFVTELFLSSDNTYYTVCFRPLGTRRDSVNSNACEYVNISTEDAMQMAIAGTMKPEKSTELDIRLAALGILE